MVEVALNGYISGHRRHRTDLRALAGSYIPVLPACAVTSVLLAKSRYLPKKDKGGFDL